jgi:hypothetical protein
MERMTPEGLALEELEAHGRAELLPDRVEMRRFRFRFRHRIIKRVRSGPVTCSTTNVAGGHVVASNRFQCQSF